MPAPKRKRTEAVGVSARTLRRLHAEIVRQCAQIGNSVEHARANDRDIRMDINRLSERVGTLITVVEHCTRLMREKETLLAENALLKANPWAATAPTLRCDPTSADHSLNPSTQPGGDTYTERHPPHPLWAASRCADNLPILREGDCVSASRYMARPVAACSFAHLHASGVECAICGVVP